MYDLLIKNGRIYNGNSSVSYISDIGIKDDKIVRIDNLSNQQSREIIDASNLSIMPGFIDTHCHSDIALLYDKQHINALYQGITTEILGQDGLSYAPLSIDKLKMYVKFNAGLNGYFEEVNLDFTDVESYLSKFHNKASVNVAYQIPHGAIRLEVLGFIDIPLHGYHLEKAKDLIRSGFDQGAVAFSTGLSYFPQSYSDTEELTELSKVCVEYNAPFVIHLRSVFRDRFFNPIEEAIEVARRSGVRLHFSHFRTDDKNCGNVTELLKPIEKAIEEGLNITMELYPYYSGSGYAVCFLPPWVVEGGYEATLEKLKNPLLRKRITDGMKANKITTEGTFTHLKENKKYIGIDFKDVAKKRNQSVEDMICDVMIEEDLEVGFRGNPTINKEKINQMDKDFICLLSRPYYMVGTDGIPIGLKPHPRAFGSFPKILKLAKQYGMSYEILSNRTSFLPAKTFNLKNRGAIEKNYIADIVIFDPENVKDNATYKDPRRPPDGIEYVIVNGKIAVFKGKATGLFAGKSIKRGQ